MDPLAVYNPVQEIEFYFDGQHNGGIYNSGNLAPYIYCYQNPLKYIDPNGKQVAVTQVQQWNGAFKEMIRTFAGTFDNIIPSFTPFFSSSKELNSKAKIEVTTSATFSPNFLDYLDAKQFDQKTTTPLFDIKTETKEELKITIAKMKVNVRGVDVSSDVTNVTNLSTGKNSTDVKIVAGKDKNGLFVTNSTDTKTGKNTTKAGVQLESPKVNGTTLKIGISTPIGKD